MDIKFLISIFAVIVIVTSCFGCIQWPPTKQENNTTNQTIIIQTGDGSSGGSGGSSGGSSGGPSGARACPNCGYYPWYLNTRCPSCGYGDNDGILICPSCGSYSYHASGYGDPNGYCTVCGYHA